MITVAACLAAWVAIGIALGVVIGKAIKNADCCPHDEAETPEPTYAPKEWVA